MRASGSIRRHSGILARADFTRQPHKKCYCRNLVSKRLPDLNEVMIHFVHPELRLKNDLSAEYSVFRTFLLSAALFFLISLIAFCFAYYPLLPFFFLSITKESCCYCFISLCFFIWQSLPWLLVCHRWRSQQLSKLYLEAFS